MDSLSWDRLGFLGNGLVHQLRVVFKHPYYFANSFESAVEAREVLSQLDGLPESEELLDECAHRLQTWSVDNRGIFKRCRRELSLRAQYTLDSEGNSSNVNASDTFEQIVQSEPKYALEFAKKMGEGPEG